MRAGHGPTITRLTEILANQIHYEVFIKRGPRGTWTLNDAFESRETAIKSADELIAQSPGLSVRVMKETFKEETGDFLSLAVYEQGQHTGEREKIVKKEAELLCFQPEDLYSYHARTTISRLLEDYLSRHQVTVSELMHRVDLIEELEATGTELQHAVQKYAIAHAGENHEPIHDVVRKLNELVQKAIEMLYRTARAGRFPKVTIQTYGQTAKALLAKGNAAYCLSGGVAVFIAGSQGWDQKLGALLSLLETLPAQGKERDLCLDVVDHFVSEMLGGKAAMSALLGIQPNLGASLLLMTYLFLGREDKLPEDAPSGVRIVSRQFAQAKLANSKAAIARRIMAEVRGVKRLNPDSLEDEVKLVRKLANLLVMGQGPMLPADELAETFNARSKRLVTPETVDEFLQDITLPQERITKLLSLEENIVGVENKRTLAAYVLGAVTSHQMHSYFLGGKASVLKRLAIITDMQSKIASTGFQSENRQEITCAYDALAVRVLTEAGFFQSIDRQKISPAQKALALLKLCAKGIFPRGECDMMAKRHIIKYVQMPDFAKGLVSSTSVDSSESDHPQIDLALMKALLEETGVNALMKSAA